MIAEFIIMFREAIEASLIVGIMLAYLHKTQNQDQEKHIYLGVGSALVVSILAAYGFSFIQGGFDAHESLFEGVFLILATAFITWFILWMMENKKIAEKIRNDMKTALDSNQTKGLFAIAFISVFREGIEAVLFMAGIKLETGGISFLGGLLGLVGALIVGYFIFEKAKKFDLNAFFKVTTIFLVLIAAGLFSRGVYELSESHVIPEGIEHVWDINPQVNADGSYPLLHEDGTIGSMAKALVGYDGDPSLAMIVGYVGYIGCVYVLSRKYTTPSTVA